MQTQVATQTRQNLQANSMPFVLSRPHGTVIAEGVAEQFSSAHAALERLRSGTISAVAGALPFDLEEPAALIAPVRLMHDSAPPTATPTWIPPMAVTGYFPATAEHTSRIEAAIARMSDSALEKVVLARAVTISASEAVNPSALCTRLVERDPHGNGYAVDLSAAGGTWVGRHLIGASPEVLVCRTGRIVTCHPLAGSAPRDLDPEIDRTHAAELLTSTKNLTEHAFVVDHIRRALMPYCRELRLPNKPTLTKTRELWHLGTPIRGELRSTDTTALDLALALHPTPAVCGTPTATARDVISNVEGNRGFYAGAVGWTDHNGDGEWMVTIRCVILDADQTTLTAYAGGGIVADSNPGDELSETSTKLRTVFDAFEVQG
ncbi:isochorismate synthase [Hoyosella rhizosphaerae]|uniref:isochorismate synthase n=1 Tax=Hoyosella rhizosphaerae TaxID=1755582 RepID=A0A916TZT3_9ACTN|nr:isochorismate synthase [Hoyosella rhizosphaerae]MBN4927201.1 isochorismate synthase [Hoyosella rhizosphaerae]GGC53203.1 putative isochorismate synthase EntC [Hoyosella rhizosphaerae]